MTGKLSHYVRPELWPAPSALSHTQQRCLENLKKRKKKGRERGPFENKSCLSPMCCPGGGVEEEEEEEQGQWRGGQVGECAPPSGAERVWLQSPIQPLSHTVSEKHSEGERGTERGWEDPPPLPFLYPLPCPACSPLLSNQKRPASGAGWRREGSEWLSGRRGRCECSRHTAVWWVAGGQRWGGKCGDVVNSFSGWGGTPFMNTRASGRVYVAAACVVTPALFLSKQRWKSDAGAFFRSCSCKFLHLLVIHVLKV